MKKPKPFCKMNTKELAAATKAFDDTNFEPKPVKMTPKQKAQLREFRKWQKTNAQKSKLTLSLDPKLIEKTDVYAINHGVTFSEVVSDALQKLMQKKANLNPQRENWKITEKIHRIVDSLEANDDVQNVYTNATFG